MYLDSKWLQEGLNKGFTQEYYFNIIKNIQGGGGIDKLPVNIGLIIRMGFSDKISVFNGKDLSLTFPLQIDKEEINYYDIISVISRYIKGKYSKQTLDKIIPKSHLIPSGILKVEDKGFTLLFSLVFTTDEVLRLGEFTFKNISELDYTKLNESAKGIEDIIIEVNQMNGGINNG
ncbi:MAG: hypothetical protein R3Y64_10330 [Peptostreptococcaceae bacterium]